MENFTTSTSTSPRNYKKFDTYTTSVRISSLEALAGCYSESFLSKATRLDILWEGLDGVSSMEIEPYNTNPSTSFGESFNLHFLLKPTNYHEIYDRLTLKNYLPRELISEVEKLDIKAKKVKLYYKGSETDLKSRDPITFNDRLKYKTYHSWNFEEILKLLEERKLVELAESKSCLCDIPLKFRFIYTPLDDTNEESEVYSTWYEADFLGTSLGRKITNKIFECFNSLY